jgi:bifunctional DNA-binding transcriptional regulator/antitoxin component of YhaV-PrlF toxin-antitoxin module
MNETTPMNDTTLTVYRLRVDPSGRIVIPVELRDRYEIAPSDEVLASAGPDGIRLFTVERALEEARVLFARHLRSKVGNQATGEIAREVPHE